MQTTLAALAVLTAGYILAYLLFDRLRDRYGYVGGAEYVLLGVLLGPHVTRLLDAGRVQDLTPIVSLAIGWLGMLLGTYFRLPTLALLSADHVRIAFAEAVATFTAGLGALLLLFRYLANDTWADATCPLSLSRPRRNASSCTLVRRRAASANRDCINWVRLSGRPNKTRSEVCASATSRHARAAPSAPQAMPNRA